MNCTGADLTWSVGESCSPDLCPNPPGGACCNLGNGQCQDNYLQVVCVGNDLVWIEETLCANVACSVPPQDPCPCDANVDNNGIIDINDAVCIMECRGGDCSCCLSSCDVNCDGVVDEGDASDDIFETPSAWLCRFRAGAPEACCPGPSGPSGACCDSTTGICINEVFEGDCTGVDLTWSEGLSCAQVECIGPPTGACCNTSNGHCTDGAFEVDCAGAGLTWSPSTACSSASCSVPPQDPCTCGADVNNDGVVSLVDAACIADCKLSNCSCCLSSCDVNCDGVVDAGDLGDDTLNDDSAWLCLFLNMAPETCCAVPPVPDATAPAPGRYLRFELPAALVRGSAKDAIRITIVSLDGFAVPALNTLWVGASIAAPEEDSSQPGLTFTAAPLQCAPHFRNWGGVGVISVYAAELMPGSEYIVQRVSETCADLNDESCYTAGLTISTGKFGDIVDPFHPDSAQPDFRDIAAIVKKFQADPGAPIKSVAQIQGKVVDPMKPVSFKDIANVVSAYVGTSFAEILGTLGPCVCPSPVVCGATACASDDECGGGLCTEGACADACGRCRP